MTQKIGIIGCGLIGGSIAKDCINLGFETFVVSGNHDKIKTHLPKAVTCKTLPNCDIVVIAAPLCGYSDILKNIESQNHKIITDVGSVRGFVDNLTNKIDNFIGSHPIAGKENSGIENSIAGLFVNKKIIIANEKIADFWIKLGGIPEIISAQNHDKIYGLVSHFIHLLAFTFDEIVAKNNFTKLDTQFLASYPKYKDFRRIGFASREIWEGEFGIFKLNKQNIITAFDEFKNIIQNTETDTIINLAQNISISLQKILDFKYIGSAATSMLSMQNINFSDNNNNSCFSINNLLDSLNNKINLL